MSASRRLARLKRSSVVNDVNGRNENLNSNVVVGNVKSKEGTQQRVDPMTVLAWHEQRLDRAEDKLKDMGETINPQLIVSLVETIEEMEKKLNLLNDAYNTLINERTKEEVKVEVSNKSSVGSNTMKLNIVEKN